MSLVKEFKDFAAQGNVMDLAVGVIIGGAFGKIVTSLVNDLVMPGLIDPVVKSLGADWRTFSWMNMKIGAFAGTALDFLIIAFVIFMLVKSMHKLKKPVEKAATVTVSEVSLLQEILEEIKKRK